MVAKIWTRFGVVMFNTLLLLQKQLVENQLAVVHSGRSRMASFEWQPPAGIEQIQAVEQQLSVSLPQDYQKFLGEISNGAVLFHDKEYGQWGFKLFGTTEIVEKRHEWQRSLPTSWESGLVAFGELFGEANALVFDTRQLTKDSLSCRVLESNTHDKFSDWVILSRSFHEWLEHLVIAQGQKFWLWR